MSGGAREAEVLARYLIGRRPPREAAARYAKAAERLGAPGRVSRLCVRVPLLLGPCDAWLARIAPQGDLRKRLLVMAAILETHPETAGHFLPIDRSRARIAAILARAGLRTAWRLAAGFALLPLLRSER